MKRYRSIIWITWISLLLFSSLIAQNGDTVKISKLDPVLQRVVAKAFPELNLPQQGSIRPFVSFPKRPSGGYPVIIHFAEPTVAGQLGVHLNTRFSHFATALLTPAQMLELVENNGIRYIETGVSNRPLLDLAVPKSGAGVIQAGLFNNTPYRGEGTLVLIYDTGIDWRHRDFRDPADTTKSRILAIWDQTLTPGTGEHSPNGFNYGVEYLRSDIEDEIDGTPTHFVRTQDLAGHGTHVAGIVAGNGAAQAKKYSGMAPGADLIIVKGGDSGFEEAQIIDGLTYARNWAEALGRPMVVNLSLGGHNGPHDGTRSYEVAIDSFCTTPGRAVVVAAGNEGNNPIHIAGNLTAGGSTTITINVPSYTPNPDTYDDFIMLDIWYDGSATIQAVATSPGGISVSADFGNYTVGPNKSDGTIEVWNVLSNLNNQHHILLAVYDENNSQAPASGTWTLTLSNASGEIQFDGWLAEQTVGNQQATLSEGNTEKTVGMPGTAHQAITVGSYVTRWSWPSIDGYVHAYSLDFDGTDDISNFSSKGPTRDGRIKPEVAAPGQGIISALSNNASPSQAFIIPGNVHYLSQGTSMAAPMVAGGTALLFEQNPSFTAAEIKNLFISSANSDRFTGSTPNYIWGYGKFDMLEAFTRLASPNATAQQEVLSYHFKEKYSFQLNKSRKLALRFTPNISGRLTGAYVKLAINAIVGSGGIRCEVYSNTAGSLNGIPGSPLGNAVDIPIDQLNRGTVNYFNLLDAGVDVIKGTDYHLVLSAISSDDYIYLLVDDSTRTDYRSSIQENNQWYNFGDPASGWGVYNLYCEPEVTQVSGVTALEAASSPIVETLTLLGNYPNPFNPGTVIKYRIGQPARVKLVIFDNLGREIRTLVDEQQSVGTHQIRWNGKNAQNKSVASGIYYYRLRVRETVKTGKMLLLK